MENLLHETVGGIVARDFRTAAVFTGHRIDFCCGGSKTLAQACRETETDPARLAEELETVLASASGDTTDFRSWPLDLLADYIVKKHHRYVAEKTPLLLQYLARLVSVHGDRHPELHQVRQLFGETAAALAHHMQKEERVLFPFVLELVEASLARHAAPHAPFGTVRNPVLMMEEEHEAEGERLRQIAALTGGYTPPEDACGTYRVTLEMLRAFEQDLHKHIHLENNILFPGAIRLEGQQTQSA